MQPLKVTVVYRNGDEITRAFDEVHKADAFFQRYMNMTPERGKPLSQIAKVIRGGSLADWSRAPFDPYGNEVTKKGPFEDWMQRVYEEESNPGRR